MVFSTILRTQNIAPSVASPESATLTDWTLHQSENRLPHVTVAFDEMFLSATKPSCSLERPMPGFSQINNGVAPRRHERLWQHNGFEGKSIPAFPRASPLERSIRSRTAQLRSTYSSGTTAQYRYQKKWITERRLSLVTSPNFDGNLRAQGLIAEPNAR